MVSGRKYLPCELDISLPHFLLDCFEGILCGARNRVVVVVETRRALDAS